jgi:hypothetical protein
MNPFYCYGIRDYVCVIYALCFLLFSMSTSHSFETDASPQFLLNTNSINDRNASDSLVRINLGFLGYQNYEKRKNYSNNCFSYNCTNVGITFKINFPTHYIIQ